VDVNGDEETKVFAVLGEKDVVEMWVLGPGKERRAALKRGIGQQALKPD
jgi:hypothetical protein